MAKLTKRLVDSLRPAPGGGDLIVWDDALPGFGVRVKPSGVASFCIQYRSRGQSRRATLGRYGVLTVDQARRLAAQMLAEVAQGADPASQRRADREAATLRELAERYLREHAEAKKKPASVFRDRRLIERFIVPALGRLKIEEVDRAAVARLHSKIGETTPTQANRVLAVLSKMMTLAMAWGLRSEALGNPCKFLEKFKEARRERYLSEEELARLGATLAEIERECSELPGVVTALRLLVLTGCRREEVLALKWAEVDLAAGILRLGDSKTGAREVPLGAPALELLERTPRQPGNPYVCPGRDFAGHLVGLPRAWARVCERAGLVAVRIHDLRHSFASVAVGGGMSLPTLGKLLGHTQPATTSRYSHLARSPLKDAADQVAGKLAEAMAAPVKSKVVKLPRKGR